MTRGKRYKEKDKLVEKGKLYAVGEALELVKQTASAKFPETVDLAVRLGVDPKKLPAPVRGTVVLPSGTGKKIKVAVVAKGEKAKEAEEAGAEVVGSEDLIAKIQQGFSDFEVLIATPDMMGQLGRLGKILGPKGLMPNPKSGTVTFEIGKTIGEFKGGKLEFKMDKAGVVHSILGKVSFEAEALQKNFWSVLASLLKVKPSGLKGSYIQTLTVSSSMGPGVKIDPKKALDELEKREQ